MGLYKFTVNAVNKDFMGEEIVLVNIVYIHYFFIVTLLISFITVIYCLYCIKHNVLACCPSVAISRLQRRMERMSSVTKVVHLL